MAKSDKFEVPDLSQREGESNRAYYIRLAKQADQRLVRLEKLSEQKEYEAVTSYAYRTAMNNLKNYGQKRFNAKVPDTTTEKGAYLFREKLAAVKEFLRSPSSGKSGIKNIYEDRVDVINSRYETVFDWQDMADFFNSGYAAKLFNELKASKTVMKAIGVIQKNLNQIKEGTDENLNLNGVPAPVRDMAIRILRRKRTSEAFDLTKEDRARFRDAIRKASKNEDPYAWQQVSDEDEIPFS